MEGGSGTGKTRLAQRLPALLPQPADGNNILDETNRAPVEWYLAGGSSVLESGWEEDGWTRGDLGGAQPLSTPLC